MLRFHPYSIGQSSDYILISIGNAKALFISIRNVEVSSLFVIECWSFILIYLLRFRPYFYWTILSFILILWDNAQVLCFFLLDNAEVSSLFLLDDADVSSLFVLLFNDAEVSSLFLLDDADNGCMKILKFKSLFLKFYITVSGRLDQVTSRTNKKTSCALCKPPIGRTIMWSFVRIVSLQLTSGLLAGNWTTGIMVFYPTIICIYPERRGKILF